MPLAPEDFADQDDNDLFRSIKEKDWDLVRRQLQDGVVVQSGMVNTVDTYGNTPLHAALGYKAPDDILTQLISLHPDACRFHGSDDWLPLHVAAMWGASSTVVEMLIRSYPEGLDDKASGGIKGRTPRHFSARFPHNRELLERSTNEWKALIDNV